ncbi:unnamed protein product [Parnassius apollo]|uniref:(apollo) hypothetical protein n=1 Tax=Parnassius apollo TaxID=110799 RepID=A0A8S3W2W1_PARAO|nr:unnamed protein product [Parnassius apollo]
MLVTYLEASRDLCETDSILFGAALDTRLDALLTKYLSPGEQKKTQAPLSPAQILLLKSSPIETTQRQGPTLQASGRPDITQKLTERIDDLKQKIAAWGKRIRRFSERSRRFNQNRLFQSDQKRLYKSLERPEVCGAGPGPDQADTVAFWRGLWSEPVNYSEGPWMEVVKSHHNAG